MKTKHTYGANHWLAEDLTGKERKKMARIKSDIRTMYDQGIPLFTKDAIRYLMEQLKLFTEFGGDKISIRGIIGAIEKLDIETGRRLPWGASKEAVVYDTYYESDVH
jgi:hypothetical protein